MHAVNLYINESLNEENFKQLRSDLMHDSHIVNVAYNSRMPHDMLVEYDETYVKPKSILGHFESLGLHADITGG